MYLKSIISKIEQKLQEKENVIVAIDGNAASGKSTAAGFLAEYFHGTVIHMDDFFLPLPMRTQERLSQPGGNVHWERFLQEVWKPLCLGNPFSYRRFDCSRGDFGEEISINPAKVTIIEGAYSMKPDFISYDVGVFFESDRQVQYRRVLERNGEEKLKAFQSRFIPMEDHYFTTFQIKKLAHCVIDTSVIF